MSDFDKRRAAAKLELRPKLTPKFLSTLTQAAETCGWEVDLIEVERFIRWCHDLAGQLTPELAVIDPDD